MSVKVNYDSTTGEIKGFYPDDITYASIPEPYIEIDDTTHQDCIDNPGLRKVDLASFSIVSLTSVYCYSGYGLSCKTVTNDYTVSTGEVLFSTTPTESQLISAFPSVASTRTFTVSTNAVTGDTLTILGQVLTFGTTVPVGDTPETTVTNIATYLNTLKVITGNYKVIAKGSSLVVSEAFVGGGIVIPDATTTGTLKMTSGTATESVWGYTTQLKHEQRVALEASADTIRDTYCKNYIVAMAKGDTSGAQAVLNSITALNDNLYKAMEAINNG